MQTSFPVLKQRYSAAGFVRNVLLMAFVLLLPAVTAQAQDVSGLRNEVTRLRQDVADLQRQLASQGSRGAAMPAPAATSSSFQTVGSETLVAQLQVRIEQMDGELRSITGQMEQVNYQVSQIGQRLDKLMADIDFRLGALEGRKGGAAPAPSGSLSPQNQGQSPPPPQGQMSEAIDQEMAGMAPLPPINSTLEDTMNRKAAAGIGAALPAGSPEEQYAQAFGLLRAGDYSAAAAGLTEFLKAHPTHELAGNATYWLGETYYVRKDYAKAGKYFLDGYQKFPQSRKGADNLLKLGMTLAALDQKKEACQALKEIKKTYPKAPDKVTERASFELDRLRCT